MLILVPPITSCLLLSQPIPFQYLGVIIMCNHFVGLIIVYSNYLLIIHLNHCAIELKWLPSLNKGILMIEKIN